MARADAAIPCLWGEKKPVCNGVETMYRPVASVSVGSYWLADPWHAYFASGGVVFVAVLGHRFQHLGIETPVVVPRPLCGSIVPVEQVHSAVDALERAATLLLYLLHNEL